MEQRNGRQHNPRYHQRCYYKSWLHTRYHNVDHCCQGSLTTLLISYHCDQRLTQATLTTISAATRHALLRYCNHLSVSLTPWSLNSCQYINLFTIYITYQLRLTCKTHHYYYDIMWVIVIGRERPECSLLNQRSHEISILKNLCAYYSKCSLCCKINGYDNTLEQYHVSIH